MEEHIKMTSEAGVVWYYFRIWEHGKCYFYGARHGKTQGEGMIVDDNPDSFQITVYEENLIPQGGCQKESCIRFSQIVSARETKKI